MRVGTFNFNQEKALVEAFSLIVKLQPSRRLVSALMGDCGELEQSWSWETMFCKVCLPTKISRGRKQEYKLKFKRTNFPEYLTLFQHKIGRNKRGHAWNSNLNTLHDVYLLNIPFYFSLFSCR